MDVRINFLLISLDAILAMRRLRWQLVNWSRIDLLFSYLEILMYGASLFKYFFENSDNPCHTLWQNYHLRWKFHFLDPPPPCINIFFARLARKQLSNRGEGGQQMLGAFFAFLLLIYGKDCRYFLSASIKLLC